MRNIHRKCFPFTLGIQNQIHSKHCNLTKYSDTKVLISVKMIEIFSAKLTFFSIKK